MVSSTLSDAPELSDAAVPDIAVSGAVGSEAATARTPILQIVPSLDIGGAERTTIDVAAALARGGYQALVVTRGGRMLGELSRVGGEWVALPVNTKAPHTLIANVFRLRNLILSRGIGLVHARSRAPAWSALYAARLAGVPFVTTYHGIYNARSSLKRFYNSVMARGDVVIANSEWTAAHIAREHHMASGRVRVIPRGVDLSRFDPTAVTADRIATIRAKWNVRPDETVILLPGRLTRWKGQTVLIDALARLAEADALGGVRAVLVGDSQGRTGFEAELHKRIADTGLQDTITVAAHENDMPAAYRAADIIVSASTDPEAFGRVAAEAGAMERPVIATNHGGAREVVVNGRTGLLTEPGDPEALAEALRWMLAEDVPARAEIGRAARNHVASRFTVERMCADTLNIYRSLLAHRG
jgi:glycosyltransferase involved in cell wall biosynthesis